MKTDLTIEPRNLFDLCRYLLFKLQVLIVFIFCSLTIAAQEPQMDERVLVIGQKIERKITGQVLHGYAFEMKSGQVLKVNIQEKGANVVAVVGRVADSQKVSAAANSGRGFMQEFITLVAEKDGVYGLVVRAIQVTGEDKEAAYELTATLENQASPADLKRAQAEVLTEETNQVFVNNDKEKLPLAIKNLEGSVQIWQQLGDKYREAVTKIYIGESYIKLENFTKAETILNEALNLFDKTQNKSEIGHIYVNLGTISILTKNETKAKVYLKQASEIFRNLGDKSSEEALGSLSLGNLSDIQAAVESDKLPDYDREIAAARAKKDKVAEASVWARAVFIYVLNSDENNRPLFERAEREGLPLIRQINDRSLEAQILVSLGLGYSALADDAADDEAREKQKTADLEKSMKYLIEGLAVSKSSNNRFLEFLAYTGFSESYYSENDKLAIFFGKKAIHSIQNFRQTLTTTTDKETQQYIARATEELYEELASELISANRLAEALQVINLGRDQEFFDLKLTDNPPLARLALTAREAENGTSFDSLMNQAIAKYAGANSQLAMNEIKAVFTKMEASFAGESSEKDIVRNIKDADEMREALEALSKETGKRHVTIYCSDYESNEILLITPDGIKAFWGGGREIFAEYQEYTSKEMPNWIASGLSEEAIKQKGSEKFRAISAEINAENSDAVIVDFLKVLENPLLDPRPLGSIIYKRILKSREPVDGKAGTVRLADELEKQNASVIHWSLAGKLRYIPIAALFDDERRQYLVEQYENVVFTRAKKESFLIPPIPWMQGVGFGTSQEYPPFSGLPDVPRELFGIFGNPETNQKARFNGRIYLDKAFTRESLLTIRQLKPAFVHIASHFNFQPGDAGKSYLLLGDGKYFSLLDMQANVGLFNGVDLLTLSACKTAAHQSDEVTGKEIDGFAELAQRLGARSVIASLWNVKDPATSELMREFYRLREENPDASKAEVLRLAQLTVLNGKSTFEEGLARRARGFGNTSKNNPAAAGGKLTQIPFKPSADSQWEHPHYWAPFVLYGGSNGGKTSKTYTIPKSPRQPTDLPGSTVPVSSAISGTWSGKYVCGQGVTGATLKIAQSGNEIQGLFEFYPLPENPTFKSGSGFYKGEYNPATGYMHMNGERWVDQPDLTWILVGFSGSFDSNRQVYTGRMLNSNCGGIELRRQDSQSNSVLINPAQPLSEKLPTNPVTIKELESSFQAKLFDETIRKARIFITYEPENKDAHAYLGYALMLRNSLDEAVTHLTRAVKLGEPIPFFVKRGRPNPLGLGQMLSDAQIIISNNGLTIIDGGKKFQAKYGSITNASLDNFGGLCPVSFIQGAFVETREKSDKVKAENKDFALFPQAATLVPVRQGNLTVFQISCSDQGTVPTVVIRLIARLRSF